MTFLQRTVERIRPSVVVPYETNIREISLDRFRLTLFKTIDIAAPSADNAEPTVF